MAEEDMTKLDDPEGVRSGRIPRVDEWMVDPSGAVNKKGDPIIIIDKEKSFAYPEGNNIKMNFAQMFSDPKMLQMIEENREAWNKLSTFTIKREAFNNKVDVICQYIDYFIRFFDRDKDLPEIYLSMKTMIDDGKYHLTQAEFKKILMKKIMCESKIKENIYRMVDANMYIDVTIDPSSGRHFTSPNDFTNEDARRLLAISLAMKLVIPLIEEFRATSTVLNSIESSGPDIIADMMNELFYQIGYIAPKGDPFANELRVKKSKRRASKRKLKPWERKQLEMEEEEPDETDLLMKKLYKFTDKRVGKHRQNNAPIWNQQGGLRGLTVITKSDELLTKYIFYDNFFKLNFSHSIVALIQSIVETQLRFTVIAVKYKLNPIEIDNEPDTSGLSSIDKVEQSLAKVDETQVIRSEVSMYDIIDRIIAEVGPISDEEIAYYRDNCVRNKDNLIQETLIQNYFAKRYNGFTELKTMPDRLFLILLVAIKRIFDARGDHQVSWFLSAVAQGRVSSRQLQNAKFMNKLKGSSTYQRLEQKYNVFNNEEPDLLLIPISRALNNRYTFVEYNAPELLGQEIEFDEDLISDEILGLIDAI